MRARRRSCAGRTPRACPNAGSRCARRRGPRARGHGGDPDAGVALVTESGGPQLTWRTPPATSVRPRWSPVAGVLEADRRNTCVRGRRWRSSPNRAGTEEQAVAAWRRASEQLASLHRHGELADGTAVPRPATAATAPRRRRRRRGGGAPRTSSASSDGTRAHRGQQAEAYAEVFAAFPRRRSRRARSTGADKPLPSTDAQEPNPALGCAATAPTGAHRVFSPAGSWRPLPRPPPSSADVRVMAPMIATVARPPTSVSSSTRRAARERRDGRDARRHDRQQILDRADFVPWAPTTSPSTPWPRTGCWLAGRA
ncbi:hypothetical protein QJS66_09220 [Kocuria rhizophila]|nr:hypothetical protein QJS66_09220 [Kocuria rhizophila]